MTQYKETRFDELLKCRCHCSVRDLKLVRKQRMYAKWCEKYCMRQVIVSDR